MKITSCFVTKQYVATVNKNIAANAEPNRLTIVSERKKSW
jgi:hypothetical protein